MNYSFGRLPPTPEKQADNDRYLFRRLMAPPPLSVEVTFDYPNLVQHYDQGNIGACTGYSASWLMSIYNDPEAYNAYWLYKRGQETDNDAGTSDDNDGGYVWAVMDVLRKEGHKEVINGKTQPIDPLNGITSYYWCRSADEIRTAFSLGHPAVFGINWYSKFNTPRTVDGEYWIGTEKNWGSILGGHAICSCACSDRRQAVRLLNSWGPAYPPVWISYKSINRLLNENGECAVAIDIEDVEPEPPGPEEELPITINIDGETYTGIVIRV